MNMDNNVEFTLPFDSMFAQTQHKIILLLGVLAFIKKEQFCLKNNHN